MLAGARAGWWELGHGVEGVTTAYGLKEGPPLRLLI